MIKVPHINGIVSDKDLKLIPKTIVGQHSIGDEWIYFETKEEMEKYFIENPLANYEPVEDDKSKIVQIVSELSDEDIIKLKQILGL